MFFLLNEKKNVRILQKLSERIIIDYARQDIVMLSNIMILLWKWFIYDRIQRYLISERVIF